MIQKVFAQKLPEVEKQMAEEKVVADLPNQVNVLKEFCLTIFVRCVVKETKLHEEFKVASEGGMSQQDISLKIRHKVTSLSKDWYRCSHFIILMA